jgi:hypothetical protein
VFHQRIVEQNNEENSEEKKGKQKQKQKQNVLAAARSRKRRCQVQEDSPAGQRGRDGWILYLHGAFKEDVDLKVTRFKHRGR